MPRSEVLKKDLFGEVIGIFDDDGDTIIRDAGKAATGLGPLARWLLRREARALIALEDVDGAPALCSFDGSLLVREYLRGEPMQRARPKDPDYFRQAARLLRAMHRAGVVHNDLAKEPNLLVRDDGRPAFIDFQLAWAPARRGRIFRGLAREDLRHLLKHKRTYCPDRLTRRERDILSRPTWPSRLYAVLIKPVYLFVTRRLLGWADREGAGDRQHP